MMKTKQGLFASTDGNSTDILDGNSANMLTKVVSGEVPITVASSLTKNATSLSRHKIMAARASRSNSSQSSWEISKIMASTSGTVKVGKYEIEKFN
ncbi:hypothetical protein L195_g038463 [Trifolium pratense]|uniref:Uncharacterized protein n=1 Tax=Trifolium pratense TaxID=57577 RepID=A0A2K3LV65_TRIPR|nr:hypothetical protein L195_g038463 [Trifolium pratense]